MVNLTPTDLTELTEPAPENLVANPWKRYLEIIATSILLVYALFWLIIMVLIPTVGARFVAHNTSDEINRTVSGIYASILLVSSIILLRAALAPTPTSRKLGIWRILLLLGALCFGIGMLCIPAYSNFYLAFWLIGILMGVPTVLELVAMGLNDEMDVTHCYLPCPDFDYQESIAPATPYLPLPPDAE